jgi:hypothetical protein
MSALASTSRGGQFFVYSVGMSEQVWVTNTLHYHNHYHSTDTCYRLRGVLKRSSTTTLVQVDLDELPKQGELAIEPCSRCYPELVRPRIFKKYCTICASGRACVHNGGVLVKGKGRNLWVWPDRAHLFERLAVAD